MKPHKLRRAVGNRVCQSFFYCYYNYHHHRAVTTATMSSSDRKKNHTAIHPSGCKIKRDFAARLR